MWSLVGNRTARRAPEKDKTRGGGTRYKSALGKGWGARGEGKPLTR